MEVSDATSILYLLFAIPISTGWGFLMSLDILPSMGNSHDELRIKLWSFAIVLYLPFAYRYEFKKSIKKNKYEIFRKKWGNEPLAIRRRRKWLIIALFVFNCIIFPLLLILLQILLKHN